MINTTDGGQNWDTIDFNYKVVDDFNDVMCNSDGSVYIFEREIIYSSDKGQTWSLLVEDAPLGASGNFSNAGTTLWGVGWGGTQEPCRVKSTDDGETWTSFTIPDEDNGGIRECNSANSGGQNIAARAMEIIVQGTSNGTDERVLYSDDEGSSWEEMTFPEDVEYKYGSPFKSQDGDVFCFYETLGKNFLIFGDSGDPVGLKDASLNTIKLYPNPAENKLYFEEPINGYTRIMNIQGQLVKELNLVNQNNISIDEINPGMYILEVNNQRTSFIKK